MTAAVLHKVTSAIAPTEAPTSNGRLLWLFCAVGPLFEASTLVEGDAFAELKLDEPVVVATALGVVEDVTVDEAA